MGISVSAQLLGLAIVTSLQSLPAGSEKPPLERQAIEGHLVVEFGKTSILRTDSRNIPLAGKDQNVSHTFADSRISGKRMRLVGRFRDNGVFEVHEFFVVRPEGLFSLIYFCET